MKIHDSSQAHPLVIVGMSGGVDSSVAAYLLCQQGYHVQGLFMDNWDDEDGYCMAAEDFQDAKKVCEELNIPLHKVNFSAQYQEQVFKHFLAEYKAGRTPNPDILCNREIKFKVFLSHAERLGANYIATGHYAQLDHAKGHSHLKKAVDGNKDQTYFLHAVEHSALEKTLFPLGALSKPEVRNIATEVGFENHNKRDSTGICFIGERKFRSFLNQYLPAQPGEMITPDGEVVGQHMGLMFYTMGQRQGLGIGGRQNALDEPWYVLDKNLDKNQLIVGQGHDHPALFHEGLIAGQLHWIQGQPGFPLRCSAKTRYRQADQLCLVETTDTDHCKVTFDESQRAITPGQSVVFYLADECLGGGVIESRYKQSHQGYSSQVSQA